MSRLAGVVALVGGVALFAACGGSSDQPRVTPKGDAITVGGTTISAAELVDELRIIADNDEPPTRSPATTSSSCPRRAPSRPPCPPRG
ncbi:MAG TPA: hypothetical protein VFF40_01775 [Acidimicrobiia bacterium]|nr:hypothetical protein [Acidimicrobiia bacterium]